MNSKAKKTKKQVRVESQVINLLSKEEMDKKIELIEKDLKSSTWRFKEFAFTTNGSDRRTAPGYKDDDEQAAYITTTQHSTSKTVMMGVDSGSQLTIATNHAKFFSPSTEVVYYYAYADMSRTYYLYTDPMGGVGTTIWGRYFP